MVEKKHGKISLGARRITEDKTEGASIRIWTFVLMFALVFSKFCTVYLLIFNSFQIHSLIPCLSPITIKQSHTSTEWGIKFFYLKVDPQISSPLHEWGTKTEYNSEGACSRSTSTCVVPKIMPKVGQHFKGHWLKEFPWARVPASWPYPLCFVLHPAPLPRWAPDIAGYNKTVPY